MAGLERYLSVSECKIFNHFGRQDDVDPICRQICKRMKHREENWTTLPKQRSKPETEEYQSGMHSAAERNYNKWSPASKQGMHKETPHTKRQKQSTKVPGITPEKSYPREKAHKEGSKTTAMDMEWNIGMGKGGPKPTRIVLLGPEGVGKSMLGNLLLKRNVFTVAKPSMSGSGECRGEEGGGYQVVDTPGKPFTGPVTGTLTPILNAVEQADVIIFVLNTTHKRTPDMGINAFHQVLQGAHSITFLVTTHADTHYRSKGTTELLDDLAESPEMKRFLERIENRVVMVELGSDQPSNQAISDGTAIYEEERVLARNMVVAMVDHVSESNTY